MEKEFSVLSAWGLMHSRCPKDKSGTATYTATSPHAVVLGEGYTLLGMLTS